MTKEPTVAVYTQLRCRYKQYVAAQLKALLAAQKHSRRIPPEEEAKCRAMWRVMLAEYKTRARTLR